MIHYQLRCGAGHDFDGWFRDGAAYESQAGAGLLRCPSCGDGAVTRALMAPALARRRDAVPAKPERAPEVPDETRAVLQRLRAEVERRCDYVGADFAAEARRIHEGGSDRRAIYGETTPDQAEALAEDGIGFARIPWVKRAEG